MCLRWRRSASSSSLWEEMVHGSPGSHTHLSQRDTLHLCVLHHDAKDTHIWTGDCNTTHTSVSKVTCCLFHTDTQKRSEVRPLKEHKLKHPPSSSTHFSVIGCNLATLHSSFTSTHS